MSVYIPGMEMPTRCLACQLNYDSCACILTGSRYYKHGVEFDPGEERLPDCPLVPVPPHGRLIDADALLESELGYTIPNYNSDGYVADLEGAYTEVQIENAPTIIPASEEGEG